MNGNQGNSESHSLKDTGDTGLLLQAKGNIIRLVNKGNLLFLIGSLTALILIYQPLQALLETTATSEHYSHILLIPLISCYFLAREGMSIFQDGTCINKSGIPIISLGLVLYALATVLEIELASNDYVCLIVFSAVIVVQGSFILAYGVKTYRNSLFPLLFLFFAVPLPTLVMDGLIYFLQAGSTGIADFLLQLTGVPFFREGFVFHLSGLNVEVAKQCSGIRSSMALFITGVLAAHLFLDHRWQKSLLILFILPLAMLKNGIRILTLTLLALYVDSRILTDSSLHRDGGILFFILALVLLTPLLYELRKMAGRKGKDKD